MVAITRILVPTDFSECSAAAARLAATFARRFDAAVDCLTVVHTAALMEAYGDDAYRNERIAFIHDRARAQLAEFAAAHLRDVRVETLVRDGETHAEILEAALERGCQLIVMGTHGRTGLAHLLVGSVAERVVRHSPVPVLTVRAPHAS